MKKDMLQVSRMVSLKVIEKVFLTSVAPSTKSWFYATNMPPLVEYAARCWNPVHICPRNSTARGYPHCPVWFPRDIWHLVVFVVSRFSHFLFLLHNSTLRHSNLEASNRYHSLGDIWGQTGQRVTNKWWSIFQLHKNNMVASTTAPTITAPMIKSQPKVVPLRASDENIHLKPWQTLLKNWTKATYLRTVGVGTKLGYIDWRD
jgi:hypothetical protein